MGPFRSIEEVPSRYQFVHIVARRARKLQGGSRPLLNSPSRKPTRVAQHEAMAGVLEVVTPPKIEAEEVPTSSPYTDEY
jgi:DNA-directed RNA polymerase omega subunit